LAATCLVAIGLVLEYWHPISEFIAEIRRPMTVFRWEKFMEISGAILITVGVLGEFFFAYKASRVETKLRDNNHQIEVLLTAKSSKNEREAAQLRKEAEDERLARVKIEARVAWRRLTERQKAEIGTTLRRFSNQYASLWYNAGDIEESMFASDIAESLQAAYIVIQPPAGVVHMQGYGRFGDPVRRLDTGVILQSTNDSASRSFADAIIKELTLRGFDAARQKDPPFTNDSTPQIRVNVEPRPAGPQGEFKLQAEREAKTKSTTNAK